MASTRLPRLPATPASNTVLLDDRRFHDLLPDEEWGRLPLAIWRRFSKRFADGETVVYVGTVEEASFSRAGWWLAQLARVIGGPLPTGAETGVPMVVTVTEDAASGGQIWTRICARSNGFPQVIHSAKRFAGPTGSRNMSATASAWRCASRSSTKRWCFAASAIRCRSGRCDCRCRHGSRPAISP
jgi:hypothetical protein